MSIADTGPTPIENLVGKGESNDETPSAYEAAQSQRLQRARRETEPLHGLRVRRHNRRIAAGTDSVPLTQRPVASSASRAETVEDPHVFDVGDDTPVHLTDALSD